MKTPIALTLFLLISLKINADIGKETGLELPRYISIKSSEANIRVGPSKNYPIVIKYIQKGFPLKIIDEYEEWRRVEDHKKRIGWVHKSLISGNRTGIILSSNNKAIEVFNTINGDIIGKIGIGNIVNINKCKIDWCKIAKDNYKGWIYKRKIWGVNKKEKIKIGYFQFFDDLYWRSINYLKKIINKLLSL